MTINIPHLISLRRGRLSPCTKARDMLPTAFAPTPHGQTGASAQQVQTRYLSIIIVADNGALDASNYRKNEAGIIQSQLRCIRSRGASFCPPRVATLSCPLCARENDPRARITRYQSQLIDVGISNAHRIRPALGRSARCGAAWRDD